MDLFVIDWTQIMIAKKDENDHLKSEKANHNDDMIAKKDETFDNQRHLYTESDKRISYLTSFHESPAGIVEKRKLDYVKCKGPSRNIHEYSEKETYISIEKEGTDFEEKEEKDVERKEIEEKEEVEKKIYIYDPEDYKEYDVNLVPKLKRRGFEKEKEKEEKENVCEKKKL